MIPIQSGIGVGGVPRKYVNPLLEVHAMSAWIRD